MPSYQEGFPRSIWEAMANSVPVIATTVGSIPYNLSDGEDALLIPPKSADAIADKIELLINDATLRKNLIAKAMKVAREVTLESQSKILVGIIESYLSKRH
jgi:glycosyltransferase involved in cell wall biosynthesis